LADREYLEKNLYSINVEAESEESAMVKFYELIARPVQGVCRYIASNEGSAGSQ
jgi:hypothetical protein